MGSILLDLRYSIRALLKNPGFAAVGLLVLALAIAVNTAIFSIVNAVLFRPLPVRAPDELMYVYQADPRSGGLSYREYLYLLKDNDAFVDMLAHSIDSSRLTARGETERCIGEPVSANYFDLLGVKPVFGRTFVPEDNRASGTPPVAVISQNLWKSRFSSDPHALGENIELNGQSFTIVGVMGPEFKGTLNPWEQSQYWVPIVPWVLGNETAKTFNETVDSVGVAVIGRLKHGVKATQAQAFIAARGKQLQQAYHRESPNFSLILLDSRRIRLPFDPTGKVVPSRLAAALMAVAGIVLLIAAANLAGILMARGVTRRGEIAVRLAFGAPRWRIVRQLMIESVLVSVLGSALGLLLARYLVGLFLANAPTSYSIWQVSLDIPIDIRVLLFTAIAGIGAGILVGLVPALQASRTDLVGSLCGGGVLTSRQVRSRLRHWIVVPQVCLSLVLLLLAGVFVRTLLKTEFANPGYNPAHVVFVDFELPVPSILRQRSKTPSDNQKYAEAAKAFLERRALFHRRLLQKARSSPKFASVSMTDCLPFSSVHTYVIARENYPQADQARWISRATVSLGYFQTVGIPLLRGRYFDERDSVSAPRAAIVCDSMARLLWPGKDPIGEYLSFYWPGSTYPLQWMEVVGIVKEVKPVLSDGVPNPFIYVPMEQQTNPYATSLVARGYESPAQMIMSLRSAVREADPSAGITRSRTMTEAIGEILFPRRMAFEILAVSGLTGLFLASVGVYGVVSYSVAQRIREIGIRAALGAQRSDIMKLVVGEGTKVALVGCALGLALAFAATRLASSFVVAIPATDLFTFISVPLFLGTVILLACYIPARRAARVDPMVALREL